MIILKSCGSAAWGGLEIYCFLSGKVQMELGNDVTLICLPASPIFENAYKSGLKTLPIVRKGLYRIRTIFMLSAYLKKNKPGIIHTHLSNDLWFIVPALKLSGSRAKLFLTKCMESGVSKKDIFHRYLYNRVDKIFAVSEFIKKNVLRTCPVDKSKVIILNDSISLQKFDPGLYERTAVKKELGMDENDIVIGIIGRMSPGKGHELFFECAARLLKTGKYPDLKFIVVGAASLGEEKYERSLRENAAQKKLGDSLIFTGYQSDIPYYLSAMDILAFPSNEESFGGTLLEAMAMKLPVAASNSGGVTDIVINNETGILFERNNLDEMLKALEILIEDPGLRKKYGLAGRKRVEEHFEIKENMKKLEELYAS
jgi:glycosyltransferase involved in cell wall biosynthesis